MSAIFLMGIVALLALAWLALIVRCHEVVAGERELGKPEEARQQGSAAPRLLHPLIDLANCLGCGACLRACPESGVLGLIHGQAAEIHGAHCVGHGLCEEAACLCPARAATRSLAGRVLCSISAASAPLV
jgi:Pyruvate/2-oxoacid:ferredoxin oxidoreductase delta subunit